MSQLRFLHCSARFYSQTMVLSYLRAVGVSSVQPQRKVRRTFQQKYWRAMFVFCLGRRGLAQ
jgi:hypothetical protein